MTTYQEILDLLRESNETCKRLMDGIEKDWFYFNAYKKKSEAYQQLQREYIAKLERQLAELKKPVPPAKVITLRVVKPDYQTPGT